MESVLKPKKTKKANIESRRFIYFEIALLSVLCIVYWAFNRQGPAEEAEYFSPRKDSSDFYVAKEVYLFKPLPDNAQKTTPSKTKPVTVKTTAPIKIVPVTNTTVTPVKTITVAPTEQPQTIDDTLKAMKNSAEPLPANLIAVEKKPQFPGGEAAMYDFLRANLKYPDFARKNGYSGPVYLSFYVSANGRLRDIKVEKGVRNSGLNEEVIRVFSAMPAWEPGRRKGAAVDFFVTFPVRFNFE